MRIVAALGGNALLERGQSPDADIQAEHVQAAVAALTPLASAHQLVITHGNGPQVGLLAVESAGDTALTRPYPFDVLDAQTQGMIGYWLLQSLQNALPGREVASLITQTLVSRSDPAFLEPTKFVGPVYTESEAKRLASVGGWSVKPDGRAWRRVVASPSPLQLVEADLVRRLVDDDVVVVCAGGGGIPVVRTPTGDLQGVDAVVDKDATAGLVAESLGADALLLLTDVESVQTDFGTPDARPIARTTPAMLRNLPFPAGSMGPKVEAACRFVERTGGFAGIGALLEVEAIVTGDAGTIVTAGDEYRDEDPRGRAMGSRQR